MSSIPGETISWPGNIPRQYVINLRIKNSTACLSSSTTVQPLGTILNAYSGFYPNDGDDYYHSGGYDDTIDDEYFLPGGVCFSLDNINN